MGQESSVVVGCLGPDGLGELEIAFNGYRVSYRVTKTSYSCDSCTTLSMYKKHSTVYFTMVNYMVSQESFYQKKKKKN